MSSTSLDKLNKFVVNPNNNTDLTSLQSQPVLGYVGYHKEYLAIDENSKLFVWGYYGIPSGGSNGYGFSSPVQVGNSSWTSVFAGDRAFYLTSILK